MRLPFRRRRPERDTPTRSQPLLDRDGDVVALIGHSHIRSVVDAARARDLTFRLVDFWFVPDPAWDPGFTAFRPSIAEVVSRGTIVAAIGGGVYALMGLVRHPRVFDFAVPGCATPPRPDAERIPYAAVRDAMAANLADALGNLGLIRRTATGRVLQLSSPPPIEDDARVADGVRWRMFEGASREVSPAPLRLKLWQVETALVREFCRVHDIVFVPPPSAALTGGGYLRPEFHLDAIHANPAYGELVLAELAARV